MTDEPRPANYPLNCWYVIATSDEVGRSLLARQALGRRLLLFRTEDGQAAVLDDRCPHRAAPLSMGTPRRRPGRLRLPRLHLRAGRPVRPRAVPAARALRRPGAQLPGPGAAAVRLDLARQPGAQPRHRAARPAAAARARLDGPGRLAGDGRQLPAAARQRAGPDPLPVRPPAPDPPRLRAGPAAAADRGGRDHGLLQPDLHPGAADRLAARRHRAARGPGVHPARDRHVRLARPARGRDGHHRPRPGATGACSSAPSPRSTPAAP